MHVDTAWSRTPSGPWDHPDWVLTRAVAAAVIDPEEHLLIGETRLDDVPLPVVAKRLGIGPTLAAVRPKPSGEAEKAGHKQLLTGPAPSGMTCGFFLYPHRRAAGLVAALWAVAGPELERMLRNALSSVG